MADKDTKYLKDYVDRKGTATVTTKEEDTDKMSTDDFLSVITADDPSALVKSADTVKPSLQEKAENISAADERRLKRQHEREERERIQAAQEQERQEQEERETQAARARRLVTQTTTTLSNSVNPAIDRIGALPTVGGIGLLLALLGLMLLLVIPVNDAGDTRLKQLWYMLNGRAYLAGSVKPVGTQVYGGGAGASFGAVDPTTGQPTPGAGGTFGQPVAVSAGGAIGGGDPNSFRGNTSF